MKLPTAVVVAGVATVFAAAAAALGSGVLAVTGVLVGAIALLRAGASVGADRDDGGGADDGGDGTCPSCGRVLRDDVEHCEECATVGSWRK